MLARLAGRTAAQVRRCMKRVVHKVCPEDMAERAKRAERERDVATVLGLAEHPGQIPGYGTVPATVARALAADAAWVRWVSDPSTGQLLDAGGRTYRPSRALRDFIIARDVYCRFPGCSARAAGITAEIDHAEPFNHTDPATGGSTDRSNLGSLCRVHHRAKTAGLFSITDSQADGSCRWQSRTGHTYHHDPEAMFDLSHPPGQAGDIRDESDLPRPTLTNPFPCPPEEHLIGNHPPDKWWLIDPPNPDELPEPAADATDLATGHLFTALEYQLHHALCA